MIFFQRERKKERDCNLYCKWIIQVFHYNFPSPVAPKRPQRLLHRKRDFFRQFREEFFSDGDPVVLFNKCFGQFRDHLAESMSILFSVCAAGLLDCQNKIIKFSERPCYRLNPSTLPLSFQFCEICNP